MGEDRSHTGGAVGLLQAACMSELRSMLIYGNCLDYADHGRGARTYASGNGPHAVYGAGTEGGILSGGKTADGSDLKGIKTSDIVTKESFENAIMVHAAISGSTNATMHLPAIAHEFGFEISADTFDRLHRGAHYLLNIRPSGDWPAQYFLLCRRCAACHGRDQEHASSGCDDSDRQDSGRKPGGT